MVVDATLESALDTSGSSGAPMKQALLVIDVQASFPVPAEIVRGICALSAVLPSVATVERHDEAVTPFERQLGWKPGKE